jgi:hypothetical protein
MDEFFNAPVWGFIGVVATIVSIMPILRNLLEKPFNGLGYKSLWSHQEKVFSYLLSQQDVKAKKQLHVHLVEIINYGRSLIDIDDFLRPITVTYENASVVDIKIVDDPRNIQPDVQKIKDPDKEGSFKGIEFKQPLNSGDSFAVAIFLSSTGKPIRFYDARVKQIARFEQYIPILGWIEKYTRLGFVWLYNPLVIILFTGAVYFTLTGTSQTSIHIMQSAINNLMQAVATVVKLVWIVFMILIIVTWIRYAFQRRKLIGLLKKQPAKPANSR